MVFPYMSNLKYFLPSPCVRRGVSMFAMLTGSLPFTVEPFNIKQLHQKMVNGEISSIPSDISKGEPARAAQSRT